AAHERVAGEAPHAQRRRGVELDAIGDADALIDGKHLMLAVVTQRTDHEREIDLRGSRCSHRSSAWASSTNCGGASASARTFASLPIAASACTARTRVETPASSSEFGSVLRRWANAAPTIR